MTEFNPERAAIILQKRESRGAADEAARDCRQIEKAIQADDHSQCRPSRGTESVGKRVHGNCPQ